MKNYSRYAVYFVTTVSIRVSIALNVPTSILLVIADQLHCLIYVGHNQVKL